MLAFALMTSVSAFAVDELTWVEGKNLVSSNNAFVATFTVTKTDRIYISAPQTFTSVECNGVTYDYKVVYGTEEGAYKYEFDAVEGQVITMKSDFWMSPGSYVYITQGYLKLMPVTFTPAQGNGFNWEGQGMVTVSFNKACTATKACVKIPSLGMKEYAVDQVMLGGSNMLSCSVTNALDQAYNDGLLAGQPFLVVFDGIKDSDKNLYAGTGNLMVNYIAPKQQGRILSATVEDGKSIDGYEFKSWFPADDVAGLFVFEFSKEIYTGKDKNTSVELTIGNLDQQSEGRFYRETMKYTIEGSKIIVDARGKLRSLSRMFPSVDFETEAEEGVDERFEINTGFIYMALNNIYDKDGNPMYSTGQGSIGTYSFTLPYKEIVDLIACEGDRAEDQDGNVKKGGDEVRVWIDQTLKSKDGVTVYFNMYDERLGVDENEKPIYAQGMVQIPASEILTVEEDEVEGSILSFNIPELKGSFDVIGGDGENINITDCAPAEGSPLRVILQVTTKEGMPHDLVFSYIYSETAGIQNVTASDIRGSRVAYNLAGQRVNAASAKGIVIMNGKKIIK